MVFISLEDVVDVNNAHASMAPASASAAKRSVQAELPKPDTFVVVTPGSPAKPQQRAQTSSHSSRFRLTGTSDRASTATSQHFVLYVTDSVVPHTWVLAKTSSDHAQLRQAVGRAVSGGCKKFACCSLLRRLVKISPNVGARHRWRSDSAHLALYGQCSIFQQYVNELAQALHARDAECESTQRAQLVLQQFLEVTHRRADAAEQILRQASVSSEEPRGPLEPQDTGELSSSSTECPICCSELADDTTLQLPCAHVFHAGCVRVWLKLQHTCPVCRLQLGVDVLHR